MPSLTAALVVSCEHAGNAIPADWRGTFGHADAALAGHRGWDPGAATLARHLAAAFDAPCFLARASRLLIDLNRSPHHPQLFSEYTRPLPPAARAAIVAQHYRPYRDAVTDAIAAAIARGSPVLHLSAHSFTPALNGKTRSADVGLLYDPSRPLEAALAHAWQAALRTAAPRLRVRRNYPYRGIADGFTTALRKRFEGKPYLGFELEVNQALAGAPDEEWQWLRETLSDSLAMALKTAVGNDRGSRRSHIGRARGSDASRD